MNKKVVISIAVIVIILGAAAWWLASSMQSTPSQTKSTSQESNNSSSTTSGGTAKNAAATITYKDDGFSPATLSINAGETIQIANESSSPLQFSSNDHPTHTHDTELNMAVIQPGNVGTITPTKTGTWGYHNHLQPSHTGSLTVK